MDSFLCIFWDQFSFLYRDRRREHQHIVQRQSKKSYPNVAKSLQLYSCGVQNFQFHKLNGIYISDIFISHSFSFRTKVTLFQIHSILANVPVETTAPAVTPLYSRQPSKFPLVILISVKQFCDPTLLSFLHQIWPEAIYKWLRDDFFVRLFSTNLHKSSSEKKSEISFIPRSTRVIIKYFVLFSVMADGWYYTCPLCSARDEETN